MGGFGKQLEGVATGGLLGNIGTGASKMANGDVSGGMQDMAKFGQNQPNAILQFLNSRNQNSYGQQSQVQQSQPTLYDQMLKILKPQTISTDGTYRMTPEQDFQDTLNNWQPK